MMLNEDEMSVLFCSLSQASSFAARQLSIAVDVNPNFADMHNIAYWVEQLIQTRHMYDRVITADSIIIN